jgi:hypothetical protein
LRSSAGENLLALFTSRGRAATIVGDLVEQSLAHRRGWFTREVFRIALALSIRGLTSAPGRALGLAGFGAVVYGGIYAALFVASGLPWHAWNHVHEASFMVPLCFVTAASNFLTGAILARRSSAAHGPRALSALLAVWIAGWLIWPWFAWRFFYWASQGPWGSFVPWPAWMPWPYVLLAGLIFPLLYLVPLLLGAVLAARRGSRTQAR